MITYELAKELKEVGFPQRDGLYSLQGEEPRYLTSDPIKWGNAFIPTLSELIESVKDLNHDYSVHLESNRDENYRADVYEFGSLVKTVISRESLDEAVARLYIALNKK